MDLQHHAELLADHIATAPSRIQAGTYPRTIGGRSLLFTVTLDEGPFTNTPLVRVLVSGDGARTGYAIRDLSMTPNVFVI